MDPLVSLALAAFTGGVVAALAWYFKGKGLFGWWDFGAAAVSSIIGAIVLAQGTELSGPVTIGDLFSIFLKGAGVTGIATPLPSLGGRSARGFARTIQRRWKD